MRPDSFPTRREVRLRLAMLDTALSIAVLALMVGCLAALLDLTVGEWRSLAIVVAVFCLATAGVLEPVRRRFQKPLLDLLAVPAGSATPQQTRAAFRTVIALPLPWTCDLLTPPLLSVPVTISSRGVVSISLTIPPVSGLIVDLQGVTANIVGQSAIVATSNGLEIQNQF